MRLGTIAFLIGIVIFQQLTLGQGMLWPGIVSLALLCLSIPLAFLNKPACYFFWFVSGFLAASLQASTLLSTHLAHELESQDLRIEGVVDSIPVQQGRRVRFEFEIRRVLSAGIAMEDMPKRVRLSWYQDAPSLQPGQHWQLTVRLKQPHGFMNPGGFDYEAWLFRKGIRATGYVRDKEKNHLIRADSSAYFIDRFRQQLAEDIKQALPRSEFSGVLAALAVGLRHEIKDRQWQVMVSTGTNHLMAISGLHIGLVAGLGFAVAGWLWSRSARLLLYWPAKKAAAIGALISATSYAAIAGFAIPTQRALVMIAVVMLAVLLQRQRAVSHTLALALLLVLMFDPLAVMDAGFWLSFIAVAVILFTLSGLTRPSLWQKFFGIHLAIGLALLPFTLLLFQQGALISPVANFIAVPWVSLTVVPLVLLGALLLNFVPWLGVLLLTLADYSLSALWPVLEVLGQFPFGQISRHLSHGGVLVGAIIGLIWLLAPKGMFVRWLGLLWLAPLFFVPIKRPAEGEFWFTLLDVGQGLAAVVETRNHVLVYDTGPQFSASFNAGEAVVVPFLKAQGWYNVDRLVVSHGDNDHIGGAASLLKAMPVAAVLSSVPYAFESGVAQSCETGQSWSWDGVHFQILHPNKAYRGSENNRSCVLRISQASRGLLLTGDIEKAAEIALLNRYPAAQLKSDVIVAPHHGSASSSSAAFLDAVQADYALFAVGYRNRWNFPRQDVATRYQNRGSEIFATDQLGAIRIEFSSQGILIPQGYRQTARRYWHKRP